MLSVIPEDWRPIRRDSDGELVGYLVQPGERDALVVPTGLIGTPLGPPQTVEAARSVLVGEGLAVLTRLWWCRTRTRRTPSGRQVRHTDHP